MPVYLKQTWVNGPSGRTPLSAERLQHIEDGIAAVETALEGLVTGEQVRAQSAEASVLTEAEAYVNSKLGTSADISVTDNANGTVTLTAFNPMTVTDNGNGTVTVSNVASIAVFENGDGTVSLSPFGESFATIVGDIASAKASAVTTADSYTDQRFAALVVVDNFDGTVSISL